MGSCEAQREVLHGQLPLPVARCVPRVGLADDARRGAHRAVVHLHRLRQQCHHVANLRRVARRPRERLRDPDPRAAGARPAAGGRLARGGRQEEAREGGEEEARHDEQGDEDRHDRRHVGLGHHLQHLGERQGQRQEDQVEDLSPRESRQECHLRRHPHHHQGADA